MKYDSDLFLLSKLVDASRTRVSTGDSAGMGL